MRTTKGTKDTKNEAAARGTASGDIVGVLGGPIS
jgi:hypothetical protein